jgi:AcrR family transcriptional regulator
MERAKNSFAWTELGYTLFAEEGEEGLQVERLARILKLNKSGFYHYFGDQEGFCDELLKLHEHKANLFLDDVATVKFIDPDYLLVCVKHKIPIMFHQHLIRRKDKPSFYMTADNIDQREDVLLRDRWTEYLGLQDNPTLAMRYFSMVRDMLYARINAKNLDYDFLHRVVSEAKAVAQQMTDVQELRTTRSVH